MGILLATKIPIAFPQRTLKGPPVALTTAQDCPLHFGCLGLQSSVAEIQ